MIYPPRAVMCFGMADAWSCTLAMGNVPRPYWVRVNDYKMKLVILTVNALEVGHIL